MRILISSFGITEEHAESKKQRWSFYTESPLHKSHPSSSATDPMEGMYPDYYLFYLMPPVNMRSINSTFIPDYATLVLCDKLIMDETSFGMLQELHEVDPFAGRLYAPVADTLKLLHSEGFIELVDFAAILQKNRDLLQRMLQHDLGLIDQWLEPLNESRQIWGDFTQRARDIMTKSGEFDNESYRSRTEQMWIMMEVSHIISRHSSMVGFYASEALKSKKKRMRKDFRESLVKNLRAYLSYVNANIVLSNELNAGFHDWADFLPFYRHKFLSVGYEDPKVQKQTQASNRLFEVSFPEYAVTNPSALVKVLRDRRVADLRKLVQEAVEGRIVFDAEFAKTTLAEVWGIEKQVSRYRSLISYLTLPLDFLPWIGTVAQKVAEEGLGILVDRKLKQKFRWFYLISDVAETTK